MNEALKQLYPELPLAPLKNYFPDVLLLREKLETMTSSEPSGKRRLSAGMAERDSTITELWAAITLLHEACPNLPEIAG